MQSEVRWVKKHIGEIERKNRKKKNKPVSWAEREVGMDGELK